MFLFGMDLIDLGCMRMATEPELGTAIRNAKVTEWDVGDKVIGELWVWVGIIFVDGLTHAAGISQCVVGCDPIEDWLIAEIPVVWF